MRRSWTLKLAIVYMPILIGIMASFAQAASNSGITYHGRIIKPDGAALEGSGVQFKLQIRTAGTENCLLFEEIQTIDMAQSAGVFAITLNDGSGTRSDSTGLSLDRVFANRGMFSLSGNDCAVSAGSSTTWTPNFADGRRFQVYFKTADSTVWEPLPSQMINFAPMAIEAKQVGGFTAQNLLRVEGPSGPATAPALTPANATELVALVGGTSALYTKAGQLNGIAIPTSYAAGESIRWNGTTWVTYTTLAASDVQAFAKAALPVCSSGDVLSSDGTTLGCVTVATATTPDATTSTKGIVAIDAAGGIAVSGGTISLAASGVAAGTYTKVTVDVTGRVITGATLVTGDIPSLDAAKITSGTFTASQIPSLDASKITTGTFATPGMISGDAITSGTIGGSTAMVTSGAVSANSLTSKSIYVWDSDASNSVQIVAPATASLTGNYVLTLPTTDGSSGEVLQTDGTGNLSWVSASAGSVTNVGLSLPAIFSVTGGPVTSSGTFNATLASQSANTVFAAPDGSGGTPTFRSLASGDIPSLDAAKITTGTFTASQIPSLDASKVTTGTFAQSLIPALSAAQIPNLDASKITSGTLASGLIPDLDAAKTTTGTFAVARIPALDAAQITTGTFASSLIPALGAAQIPNLDASKITTGTFSTALIPDLDAAKIASGTLAVGRIPALDASRIATGTIANVVSNTSSVGTRAVDIYDSDSTNKVTIVTPATGSLTADYTLTLPVDDGTNGQVLTTNGSGALTWSSAAIGSVTSVDVNLPSIFTMAGGPVTAAGTISATLASQAANSFWAAPNGAPGAPTFRAMVAADVPALDAAKITTGTFTAAQIPDLDSAKIATGTLNAARIPDLDAAKVATGTINVARIPDLDAAKTTTGTFAVARIPALDAAQITSGTFASSLIPALGAAQIPNLDASKITTGTFSPALIPDLDAAKITSGTLAIGRIPALDASNVATGTFAASQIPTLDASKVGTGTFAPAQIPALDASKITTGTFTAAQIPALDASKTTTGTFATAQIPALDASKIATGTITNTVNNTSFVGTRSVQVFDSDSTNKVTIQTPATGTLTSDYVLTLPADDGTNGQILTTDGNGVLSWVAAGGAGTVTNVGLTLPNIFSVAGGPVTTNGTFTATVASQAQNTFWAAPDGSSGAPTFRSMVASDVPSLDAAKIATGTFTTAQIPALDAAKITSGTFTAAQIPVLDAAKITTGTFAAAQIPSLDASKTATGTFAVARIPALDAAQITTGTFASSLIPALGAAQIPNLDASKITTGTFAPALIPDLDAAKIASGTLNIARIPDLDASKTTSGTFAAGLIPTLDASKVGTGTFTAAQIPSLDASKIATGTITNTVNNTTSVSSRALQVFDSDSTNKVTIVTPATGSLTADYQIVLPADDGAANQVLQTDGSGNLTWVSQTSTGSGTFRADSGSAAVPTHSFSADTNSGMYSIVDDVVGFATGGTNRLTINASGNVGIGTTAPTSALHVSGAITVSSSSPGLLSPDNFIYLHSSSAAAVGTNLAASGRGGFLVQNGYGYHFNSVNNAYSGTLDVSLMRDAAGSLAQRAGTTAQAYRVYNTYTDSSNYERGVLDWLTSANVLRIGTEAAGTGALRNLALVGGNVGVGTTAPGTKLDVAGAITANVQGTAAGQGGEIRFQELAANGAHYAALRVPDALAANYTLTLPFDDGTNGQILTTDGNGVLSWVAAGGAGTVTNVGLALPNIFSVAGGPVTTNGTFTATLASQAQNTFWAAPDGSSGAPTFRAIVAADVPSLDAAKITTGTFTAAQIPALDASKTTTGTFSTTLIPNLDGSKVSSGTVTAAVDNTSLVGTRAVRIYDSDSTNTITIQTPATGTLASNYVLTLPADDGAANQVLQTDGSGNLTWVTQTSTGSGTFRADGGTAAIPTHSFTADTNSGMYSIVDDVVGFSTGGTSRLTINASGNVGIGTTNPSFTLDVQGTANPIRAIATKSSNGAVSAMNLDVQNSAGAGGTGLATTITFRGETTTSTGQDMADLGAIWTDGTHASRSAALTFSTVNNAAGLAERMRILPSGNVGVGTTNPATALDVNGAVKIGTGTCGASTQGSIQFDGTNVQFCNTSNTWTTLAAGSPSQWVTSGTNISYSTGNVGIGTTSPLYPLDVNGNSRLNGRVNLAYNASIYGHGYSNTVVAETTSANTTTSFWVRPNGSGNGAELLVLGNGYDGTSAFGRIAYDSSHFVIGNPIIAHPIDFQQLGTYQMRITNDGQIGMGTTSPQAKLDVNGGIRVGDMTTCTSASNAGTIRFNGGNLQLCSAAGDTWTTLSTSSGDNLGNHTATANLQLGNYWLSGDGGNEGVFVTSSGSVGIGTTNPLSPLHVNGTVRSTGFIIGNTQYLSSGELNAASGTYSDPHSGTLYDAKFGGPNYGISVRGISTFRSEVRVNNGTWTDPVPSAAFDAKFGGSGKGIAVGGESYFGGNVGIGTTAPSSKLSIEGTAAAADIAFGMRNLSSTGTTKYILNNDSTAYSGVEVYGSAHASTTLRNSAVYTSSHDMVYMTNSSVQNGGTGKIQFMTGGWDMATQTRMLIAADGKIGVGTTAPATKLDVNGSIKLATGTCGASTQGSIQFDGTNVQFCNTSNVWTTLAAGTASQWTTYGSDINYASGNVGIGITNPTNKLHVNGTFTATGGATIGGNLSLGNTLSNSTGTAASPSYSFVYGANTGMYLTSNGSETLAFSTAATERMRIMNNGWVGIGTTNPTANLDVNGGIRSTGMVVTSGGQIYPSNSGLQINLTAGGDFNVANSVSSPMVTVKQTGSLGIGTTNPGTKLDVLGAITANVQGTATGQGGEMRFRELAAGGANYAAIRAPDSIAADYVLTLPPDDGTSNQVLTTDGNGVLSWTTPSGGASSGTYLANNGSASAPTFSFTNDANNGMYLFGSDSIALVTGGANRIVVDSSGKVGIGTTSPSASLDIQDAGTNTGIYPLRVAANTGAGPGKYVAIAIDNQTSGAWKQGIEFRNGGTAKYSINVDANGSGANEFSLYDNAAGATRFLVTSSGLVGIGTTAAPQAALDVNGGIRLGTQSTCNASTEGSQRYNSTSKKMEFCNGTSWAEIGSGGGGGGGGLTACPSGYTVVAASNAQGVNSFCINTTIQTNQNFSLAQRSCASTGATLCRNRQLAAALASGALSSVTSDSWTGDFYPSDTYWNGSNNVVAIMGCTRSNSGTYSCGADPTSGYGSYCCID